MTPEKCDNCGSTELKSQGRQRWLCIDGSGEKDYDVWHCQDCGWVLQKEAVE